MNVVAFHDEEESDAEQSDKQLTPYSDNPNSKLFRFIHFFAILF